MTEIEKLDQIGRAMQAAWQRVKKSQARMWGDWMTIGEGLMEGRRWAMRQSGTNHPEGKGYVMAYAEWLKRYRVDDIDKSDRAKLLQLIDERAAVEEWRATLSDYDRRNLNNPTIAWRKWTAATRVTKPKPRSAGVSGSEHGRARTIIEELQGRVEELQEELEAAKAPRGTSRKRPATDSADPINDRIRRVSEFVIEDFAPDFERWLESKPDLDVDARYFLNHALEACAMRLQDLAQSLRSAPEGGEDSEVPEARQPSNEPKPSRPVGLKRIKQLIRFQKCLRRATEASTPGEAEAAEAAARRLLKLYDIDLVQLTDKSLYDHPTFADNALLLKLREEHRDALRKKPEAKKRHPAP